MGAPESTAVESVRFEKGVRQALAWAISTSARNGYVSPSVTRMMGAPSRTGSGLTILEQHGDAALIIALVDRQPEPYQAAIWFRAAVLPRECMEVLAVYLAPQIIRMLPTGVHNRRAVQLAILKTAGKDVGPTVEFIRKERKCSTQSASEFCRIVADKMDVFGRLAEADIEREMVLRGWA